MYLSLIALLALAVGLIGGWLIGRRRQRPIEKGPDDPLDELVDAPPVTVPEGISQVIEVLRSSAVVVGPHDEVLQSTSPARTFGIVRGSRIAIRQILDLVRTARRDDEIHTTDLELGRGPGTPSLHLSVRVAPISEDLVLVLAEDRTAARRVEETRRDFVANVSHELKTPIGAVALLAEAVEDAADDPDAVRRFAGRMSKESDRLTELVRQIIDLSRLQADDPLLAAEVIDVDGVLSLAVDRCRVDAERKNITLTVSGDKDCQVIGDGEQLAIAVTNLVENAVSYSDPRDRVAVAARRTVDTEDNFIELTVSDSGIGIAPSEVQRIFERFYRIDYARSRGNGGTGLGLSIVKHVAAAHGGQVSVWSQPGQGSTFTIRLPEYLNRPDADREGPNSAASGQALASVSAAEHGAVADSAAANSAAANSAAANSAAANSAAANSAAANSAAERSATPPHDDNQASGAAARQGAARPTVPSQTYRSSESATPPSAEQPAKAQEASSS